MVKVGIIADDFTGAGDAASFLKLEDANCILINGVPKEDYELDENIDVVVIALKTRSVSKEEAISEVNKAYDFLNKIGTEMIYFKYGSTFDSTAEGNIGPVLDDLLDKMNLKYTLISPALPINDRKVEDGILYVDGLPIDQTHMRFHPLNPMDESDLKILMERQSRYKVFKLTISQMEDFLSDRETFDKYIEEKAKENEKFYLAVDYFQDEHGQIIAELFKNIRLFSGSSALPAWLYKAAVNSGKDVVPADYTANENISAPLKGGVLAGSLSQATQKQIASFIDEGYASYLIQSKELLSSFDTVKKEIIDFIDENIDKVFIIYSEKNKDVDPEIHNKVGTLVEKVLSFAGEYAIDKGINNLVVAGGETSGAVVKVMNPNSFYIGDVISPGVPVLIPDHQQNLKVVLKSGNFGGVNFFVEALNKMN
ncbi:four-carbon acid sugar kinase family protein [Terribacillus saccharophilus]|uniref:four-carbon acid sugar kinase family protein n=1 Tax=Terribacillus saccharophilus TaxID=361277 RepID=UPI002989A9E3|nr:four-carbon acid sugar kinase family protein [Terribacillus saccharophilus]MCM3225785.1 four-carbon acid sugar kinase family protein [Terribacillus saccharophilus]